MKTKQARLELKVNPQGVFQGLLSPYGPPADQGGDIIDRGAYAKTLAEKGNTRPLLWAHETGNPIGEVTLEDRSDGLYITKGQLMMDLPEGQRIFKLIQSGIVKGLSIGFRSVREKFIDGATHLQEISLYEASACLFPMNENALITSVKQITGANHMDEKELKEQLTQVLLQLKENKTLAERQKAEFGSVKQELLEQFQTLQRQVDSIDTKLVERQGGGGGQQQGKSLEVFLKEDEGMQRLARDGKGTAILNIPPEVKTTIDSPAVGSSVSGVLGIERIPGIVQEARQQLYLRNLITSRDTTLGIIDFIRVTSATAIASMQIESSAKGELAETFATTSEKVQTVAGWIPASNQVLQDMSELAGFINTSLAYAVALREETEMLYGAGTGQSLHGAFTQASAFNTSLLGVSAWSKLEIIAAAIAQLSLAKEVPPSFVILNPTDWLALQRTKTTTGEFLLGNPANAIAKQLWGLQVLTTVNMSAGMFLVGNGNPAAIEIRDRVPGLQIEISNSHQDFFIKNLVAIRAGRRLALIVKRPGSFIAGTLTTSP
jgi:HK97 family phage major capsid protein/HK97 family phage prohead protease